MYEPDWSDAERSQRLSGEASLTHLASWSTDTLLPDSARPPEQVYLAVADAPPPVDGLEAAFQSSDYTLACSLAMTPFERMRVEHAILKEQSLALDEAERSGAALVAALVPCLARCVRAEPSTEFVRAVRGRDWTLACSLARNADDRRSVAHSILR
eukprot:4106603-Prymnesium_polylepis.1